jgi:dolichyl-diphosphooligosaccharide--protein glycosyltransferase
METLLTPSRTDPTKAQPVQLYTPLYFPTMISRLHNFDGSLTPPTNAYLVEFNDPGTSGLTLPLITDAVSLNVSDAKAQAAQFNGNAPAGSHAQVLSALIWEPIDTVPALRQYRLVHESPTNIVPLYFNENSPDIRYVKTFEYVKGAHIKGTGTIEVPIVTDTGRNFTYRQESVNGEFVVPYSTTGTPYGVHTTGKYHIVGTSKMYDVPEPAVMQGLTIS